MRLPKGLLLVALTASFAFASNDALAFDIGDTGGDFSTAWFVSPLPNATFEGAPITLDAEIGVYQGFDNGPINTVEVFVNGDSLGMQVCPDGCTYAAIELDKGVHTLEVVADIGYTSSVTVYVDEEVPVDMSDTGDSDTGTGDGETGDGGGGGCSVHDRPTSPWALLTLPLLLLVPGFRRQR